VLGFCRDVPDTNPAVAQAAAPHAYALMKGLAVQVANERQPEDAQPVGYATEPHLQGLLSRRSRDVSSPEMAKSL
jgi:hypothetical protein